MRGPILDEWDRITRTLAGMHWSVVVSYENGRPTKVRWHDCGIEQASLCMVPEQTARFEYADDRFLPACGVRPPDMRDGHFTAEVRRFDFERMESSVRRTVFAGSESTGGFECNRLFSEVIDFGSYRNSLSRGRKLLTVKPAFMAATTLFVLAISAVGQGETARTTNATAGYVQASSEGRERIELDRLLSDPAALDKLVIIYRPTYRQTLFVFGMGKVILQTYPPSFFPQDTALLPTCTANKSQSDVKDVIRTMIRAHFFDLPQKSYVDTGDENNEIEFEKEVKDHSIVVDDGASRAYRDFAEGQYRGKNKQIPVAFGEVEDALRRLAGSVLNGAPCPMGHYMEWRRTGRGETVRQ